MNHERHPSSPDKSGYAVTGEKHKIIIFKEESFAIQGAAFEVYKKMGSGFLESVYQECLEREFALRKIPFKSQVEIRLHYKDIPLNQTYRADFICHDSILVEIKAVTQLLDVHRAQVLNCLRATNLKLGLLMNFSSFPKVGIERIVL